jgi:hypothetical protein
MFLILSTSAFADQCQLVSATMAKRATLLIQKGAEISDLCEPCGDAKSSAVVSVVKSIKVSDSAGSNLKEISINGIAVDLAYIYVKVAPNKSINVAKTIGCKADGVSEIISK